MTRIVFWLAGLKLAAHLATAGHYPFHSDELYYLMCGRHPAWCYPDHPPLTPWLAGISEHLSGASPFWLRMWPAVIGALLVLAAGWLAWRLGGGRLAQTLASLAILFSPLFLLANSMMQTVSLDQLFWTASILVLVLLLEHTSRRRYVLLGLALGLGVLAKLTVLAWGLGILAGFLLTRERARLRHPWLWAAAVIPAACAAPVAAWQRAHGWPLLEFIANSRADDPVTPWGFVGMQAAMAGPIAGTLLLAAGWVFLLGRLPGDRWPHRRTLGLAVAAAWVVFIATGGKPYYAGPTYPLLFAGGAVLVEHMLARRTPRARMAWSTIVLLLLASQSWMVPFFLPIMPPQRMAVRAEGLPHDDWQRMFGWKELAAQTAGFYADLSAEERSGLRILTDNYSTAGAIDIYGASLGLPAALSGHNGYAFWEAHPALDPLIVIGYDPVWFRRNYAQVRMLGRVEAWELLENEEKGKPIFYCRGLTAPPDELWAALRHFD